MKTTFSPQTASEFFETQKRADIILIDDDDAIRAMLNEALGRLGHSLLSVADGKTAWQFLSTHSFRLIITDIFMPDMDGLELIRKYCSVHPEIPIIAISGGGSGSGPGNYLKSAKFLGCQRTLAKPFEIPELLAMVQEILAQG